MSAPGPLHTHDLRPFTHGHAFADERAPQRERALWWVTAITLATMGLELVVGYWSGSLALVADGWHMGTHALALGGAALAAHLSRRAHGNAAFAFGGWKIEVLAAYSSGLLLLAVSVWIGIDAVQTLLAPHPIAYERAIAVAVIGLVINAACAWVLARGGTEPRHGHDHGQCHRLDTPHHHDHVDHPPAAGARAAHAHDAHDHNFRAAYLHVLADALTSVLAIVALGAGLAFGWRWLDPAVALLGGALIARWAWTVLRDSARALVDASADARLRHAVRAAVETDGDARVADLHVWQVGPQAWSAVISVVADRPQEPGVYAGRLAALPQCRHVTVEVNRCLGEAPHGVHTHPH